MDDKERIRILVEAGIGLAEIVEFLAILVADQDDELWRDAEKIAMILDGLKESDNE